LRPFSGLNHTDSVPDCQRLVVGKKPPYTLLQVIQCLTELGLSFTKARVTSDGGWFVDGASFLGLGQNVLSICDGGWKADSDRILRPVECLEPFLLDFKEGVKCERSLCAYKDCMVELETARLEGWPGSQFTAIHVENPLGMQNSTFMTATGLSRTQRSSLQWKRS
jgi:hypothetical protein